MIICMCAGEASGDTLGADYILKLKKQYPKAKFYGIGGPKMIKAGLTSWFDMEELSVMGISAVLKRLPRLLSIRRQMVQKVLAIKADMFVGIDAPDFNLSLEKKFKDKGIKTIHYVSPTIWAWRPGRIHKIMAATDEVLCLFPFEVPLYEKHGHKATFVGHPLAKAIALDSDKSAAKKRFGFKASDTVIALLPGSRHQEVERVLPVMIEALNVIPADAGIQEKNKKINILLPVAKPSLNSLISEYSDEIQKLGVTVLEGQAGEALSASDAAIVTSGTATLEAMLYKTPSVVVYKTSWLTYIIGKMLVKLNFIALPNILAGKCIMPELIQSDARPSAIAKALTQQLSSKGKLTSMFNNIHQKLLPPRS